MAKKAQLADGTILEFPDETSDLVIDKTVSSYLSEKNQPQKKSLHNQVKEFVSGAWSTLNPIEGFKALARPIDTLKSIGPAQENVFLGAKEAWKAGRYLDAARKGLNYAIPILGPAIDAAGDEVRAGNIAKGFGQATGIGLSATSPKILPKRLPILPKMKNVNSAEAAAVKFAQESGIPVDAATATGNQAVRGLQWLSDRSIGGSLVADKAKQAQANALVRVGNSLAERVNKTVRGPGQAYTPEQAGVAVRDSLEKKISNFKKESDVLYGKFREIEARPENIQMVEISKKSNPETIIVEGRKMKLADFSPQQREALGYPNLEPEVIQMVDEATATRMNEMRDLFQSDLGKLSGKGKTIEGIQDMNYSAASEIKGGFGHIPIKKAFPELSDIKEPPGRIAEAIEKDKGNKLYLRVKERAEKDVLDKFENEIHEANIQVKEQKTLQPKIDPIPSYQPEPNVKPVAMPVDMRPIKASAKPLYDHMSKWMPTALRNASEGYTALKGILEGDDFVQASVAEAGLSGLKSLAREAKSPDLANVSQGIGKFSTAMLSKAIDDAVSRASGGAEALQALKAGRAKHMAKMTVAEVTKKLREEPVQTLNQLTFSKDSNVGLLRKIAKLAPHEMPIIARAFLEDLLTQASSAGAFDKTGTLWNKWQSFGPETKELVFNNKKLVQDINNFFLVAKKIAENPNPSGSGFTAALGAQGALLLTDPVSGVAVQIGAGGLSKMLRNPKAVKALTNGIQVPISNRLASSVAATQILSYAGKDASPQKKSLRRDMMNQR